MEIPGILKSSGISEVSLKGEHAQGDKAVRAEPQPRQPVDRATLESQAKALEKTFLAFNHRVELSVNEVIDQVVIKVVDKDTDRIIKEIPPEEIQHMIARIKETIGLLVDEKI